MLSCPAAGSHTSPRVTVLLSTYQGERYLPDQLNSLAAQHGVDWDLLWRDDGSTDRSVKVLEAFTRTTRRARRLVEPAERLGPARSFLTLLSAVEGDGLAGFCDQDDLWLPDKLARAGAALHGLPPDVPAMYCARQKLVGAGLEPLGLSPVPGRGPGFANAIVQNIATGCTIVLNASARRLVASHPVPTSSMHDWWCYLLVSGCGGIVVFDPEPALLYRQHGSNVVGAPGPWKRFLNAMRRGPQHFLGVFGDHSAALHDAPLTSDARLCLSAMRDLTAASPLIRLRALRRSRVYRQTFAGTLLLYVWAVLGRLELEEVTAAR